MPFPHLSRFILPFTRFEWPGCDRLFNLFVGGQKQNAYWQNWQPKNIRAREHNYLIQLDLAHWQDRFTYFYGRPYDIGVQLTLKHFIQPGDHVLDIGANTGQHTLLMAELVESSGHVDAFEPNTECCNRIRTQIKHNNIQHVALHETALDHLEQPATLSIAPQEPNLGTLAEPCPAAAPSFSLKQHVHTQIGDHFLHNIPEHNRRPVNLIKIDVEGHEPRTLRGLNWTLQKDKPLILSEVNPRCLAWANTSPEQLFLLMNELGYHAYLISTHHKRWREHKLTLTPVTNHQIESTQDILWIHHSDTINQRRVDALTPQDQPTHTLKKAA
ncbi:FkbM family methyltransferase [Poriferisphaera sp. WC338]|uniref:FkbM family methyltransferase n=1 Tax=Poriferisphaera sp. WC338 TaxID=3425129 RepID=UPI003D81B108